MEKVKQKALTFDDVLLLPRYSDFIPSEASTQTKLTKNITIKVPLVSAAMDTVTESRMAIALAEVGGIGIIHKNNSIEEQVSQVKTVKKYESGVVRDPITIESDKSIGELIQLTTELNISGMPVVDTIKMVKKEFLNIDVIGGNVATPEGALELVNAGADAIKVGMGPGSICTTRIIAGIGVPQITAILDIKEAVKDIDIGIIADGGIRFSGDIAKAIAAGADSVMLGGLFAGTEEAPGKVELFQGRSFKTYRGMGSIGAMTERHDANRYMQEDLDSEKLVPEGIEGRVPYKGLVINVINQLVGGLRQSMGYIGCKTIEAVHKNSEFIEITNAGMTESHVHDVMITKEAPNYQRS